MNNSGAAFLCIGTFASFKWQFHIFFFFPLLFQFHIQMIKEDLRVPGGISLFTWCAAIKWFGHRCAADCCTLTGYHSRHTSLSNLNYWIHSLALLKTSFEGSWDGKILCWGNKEAREKFFYLSTRLFVLPVMDYRGICQICGVSLLFLGGTFFICISKVWMSIIFLTNWAFLYLGHTRLLLF